MALGPAVVGVIVGISQWFLHQRAQREREIRIEQLVESGREELLDGHQARAAVFLNEAYKMGYDTVPLWACTASNVDNPNDAPPPPGTFTTVYVDVSCPNHQDE